MNPSTNPLSHTAPVDSDLAEQARARHGTPSQDSDPAAEVARTFDEAEREAKSVTTGGGMVAGAAGDMAVPRARP